MVFGIQTPLVIIKWSQPNIITAVKLKRGVNMAVTVHTCPNNKKFENVRLLHLNTAFKTKRQIESVAGLKQYSMLCEPLLILSFFAPFSKVSTHSIGSFLKQ